MMLKIEDLKGTYVSWLANKPRYRLGHELRIDGHGGYSSWFVVEHVPTGKVTALQGLAAELRLYNQQGVE